MRTFGERHLTRNHGNQFPVQPNGGRAPASAVVPQKVRAPFIAFCGIDGSGKTTQLNLLAGYLKCSYDIFLTRQPTDAYRKDPVVRAFLNGEISDAELGLTVREMALYAAADRLRHLRSEVVPKLQAGVSVLTDRYVYSSYAYFLARGIHDLDWLMALNKFAPTPDLVLYLDVDPEVAIARILKRDGQSRKREEVDLLRMSHVRAAFQNQPWGADERYHVLDGNQSTEHVASTVISLARRVFDQTYWRHSAASFGSLG